MANGYWRGEFEASPGNESTSPSLSTKIIYVPVITAGISAGTAHIDRDDELRGNDEPTSLIPDTYAPSWSMESRAYPDTIGFLLKALLGAPTTTAGNGVITDPDSATIPTGAYRHVWTSPFGPSGDSPQTAQLQYAYKDQSAFFKLRGAAVSDFGISNPETGGSRVTASGLGTYLTRIADPSLTPSYESLSVRPFTRSNLTLSWLSGTATSENFDINCSNPIEATRSMSVASKYPDQMQKGNDGITTWTGSIPKRSIDPDDWDAMINATGFSAQARWVSDTTIASSYPYKLYAVMTNAQYTGGDPADLANVRRIGASFDWKATSAGSASMALTLVNATSSYA